MRRFFAAAFFFDDVLAEFAGFGEKAAVNYLERFVVLGVAHGSVVLSVCKCALGRGLYSSIRARGSEIVAGCGVGW